MSAARLTVTLCGCTDAAAIARQKACYVAKTYPNDFVLGADTIVCLGKRCLGKPYDKAEAAAMLESLFAR